ncbi:hypothetical protein RQP46_007297 [Phenoliferia psychrophenolica]
MAGFFHLIGVFSLLAATVLLIVVSVSLPVWKSVYFLDVDFSVSSSIGGLRATSDHLRLGNWGLCLGDVCTKARLGYNLDFIENNTSGDLHLAASILHGATYALILHPIAAGFTFLALLVSLSTHFVVGILASVLALWAFVLTLIAFVIDLVIFITARDRLTKHSSSLLGSSDLSASYGPALWLVLTAFILQLIASVTLEGS